MIIEASQCLIPVKSNGQDNATIYRGTDGQAKGSGGAGGTIILFSSDIEEVSVSGGNGYTRYDPIGGDGSVGRVIIKQYRPSGQIRVPKQMPVQAVSYQDMVSLISVSRRDLVVNSGKTSITDQASGQEWDYGGSAGLVLEDGIPCLDLTAGALTLNGTGATMGQEYTLIYYWKPIVGPNIWRTLHRSDNVDHLVIVNTGATDLGMFSNRNGNFRDTGYNITPGVWQTLIVTSIGDSPTSSTGTGTFFVNDENVGTVDRVGSGTQIKTISYVESDGDFQSPGYIAAAGIFNRILSRKEITKVHHLLEKWGKGQYVQNIPRSVGRSFLYTTAKSLYDAGIRENGVYQVRPPGYSGAPFPVFCDLDGTVSGIGSGGWMRVEYAEDKFTQANPWTGTGDNDVRDGSPYSGDFVFSHTTEQINAMKSTATQIRQTFQSFGYGSVGWTYGSGTSSAGMGCRTHEGTVWISSGDPSIPSNTDYSFLGWDANGVLEPRGTDPTDANDATWRESLIYLIESGNTYLPILGVYSGDVDGSGEQRYFPLASGGKSFVWIK